MKKEDIQDSLFDLLMEEILNNLSKVAIEFRLISLNLSEIIQYIDIDTVCSEMDKVCKYLESMGYNCYYSAHYSVFNRCGMIISNSPVDRTCFIVNYEMRIIEEQPFNYHKPVYASIDRSDAETHLYNYNRYIPVNHCVRSGSVCMSILNFIRIGKRKNLFKRIFG